MGFLFGGAMATKSDKLHLELEKAKAKRAELDEKIKDLEQKCIEAENTEIHEMVRAANLSPEELSRLIHMATAQKVHEVNNTAREMERHEN